MANSSIYNIVQPGAHNGGNAATANALDSAKMPFAWCPNLRYEQTITWKDLRDATDVLQIDEALVDSTVVAGVYSLEFTDLHTGASIHTVSTTVHEDTVTVGGTASDGNYDIIFDALDPPVRARTVRATTPADNTAIGADLAAQINDLVATSLAGVVASAAADTGVVTITYEAGIDPQTLSVAETTATGTLTVSISADEDAIATALEAEIEAARAADQPLEDYVDDESVATDTVTIEYVAGVQVRVTPDVPATADITVTTTDVATITLGSTGNYFPSNVMVAGAIANVSTAFDIASGTPTITMEVGGAFDSDPDDPNGLLTSSSLATAAVLETIGATLFVEHFEAACAPSVTVTSDVLFADLTQGEVSVMIRWSPVVNFE